jgi:hypothetical protein
MLPDIEPIPWGRLVTGFVLVLLIPFVVWALAAGREKHLKNNTKDDQ